MILLHSALQCEAQCIIEKYKLKKTNSNPKIYSNETLLVLIGGVGKENTLKNLNYIFKNYTISKAINLGIAGCSDQNTPIGAIFSCFNQLPNLEYKKLITVDTAQIINYNDNSLYDMEGSYFLEVLEKYLDKDNINIYKVVSDHLNDTQLNKDHVKYLMYKNIKEVLKNIEQYKQEEGI